MANIFSYQCFFIIKIYYTLFFLFRRVILKLNKDWCFSMCDTTSKGEGEKLELSKGTIVTISILLRTYYNSLTKLLFD